jgi:hypothetical protein
LSFVAFALHAALHVWRSEAHDLLWACNVAPLVLSAGCVLRRARLAAIALLWLVIGTPLWAIDLATGADLVATSPLVHVGVPVVAFVALRRLGFPRGSWYRALFAFLALALLTRLVTSPAHNVNLVFAVWAGWETYFPRHEVYFTFLLAVGALGFFVTERLWTLCLPATTTVAVA